MIIVGGGPSGCSAAFFNAKKGKKVLLLDKDSFPRDKICGDGVTGKSLVILDEMGLSDEISKVRKIISNGVKIYTPNKLSLRIPIQDPKDPLSAFSIERNIMDNLIFERAKDEVMKNGGEVKTEKVLGVLKDENGVVGVRTKDNNEYRGKVIIGAGGYNCPISRYTLEENNIVKQEREHYSSAIREYWKGIEGSNGDFEIHFIEGVLPGYFWIFPISEDKFNIGVGMLLSEMDNQKVKLKKLLDYIVEESYLSERFVRASAIPKSRKGWMLPLGSPRKGELEPRKNFTQGCLLIGDAASLIDPFTGEGIGNGLLSGKLTANYELDDERAKIAYQEELWSLVGKELTNSYRLQKMLNKKWLVNWFIKRARKKPKLQGIITDMLNNKETQGNMNSKWFILKNLLW